MNISAVSPVTQTNTMVSQTGPAEQPQGTSVIAKEELVETRAAEFSEPLSKQVMEGEASPASASVSTPASASASAPAPTSNTTSENQGRLDIYA